MGANKSTYERYKAVGGRKSHHRAKSKGFDSKHTKPPCPEYFSKEQEKEWDRFSEMFYRLSVLTETDSVALEMLVVQYCKWRELEEMASDPECQKYATMTRLASDAFGNLNKIISKFGMSPTDRTKIGLTEKKKSEIGEYLDKQGKVV